MKMLSIETRKYLLRLISLILFFKCTSGCGGNEQIYTEIGCKPIYNNGSNSCPVAYNCDNIFNRPSDKCYFNGNVYNPETGLTTTDSALNPCLASCFCGRTTHESKTTTKFTCAYVQCPAYFAAVAEPCYFQYHKDSCCESKLYCPEENATIHTCVYDGNTYRDGQRFNIGNLQCVCSPEFKGTASDQSCKKISCGFELLNIENILKRNAPVYFEKVDGCPINWYDSEYNAGTVEKSISNKSSGYECKYGDLSIPLGQKLRVGKTADSDTYKTVCSCDTPPLVTCITGRKDKF